MNMQPPRYSTLKQREDTQSENGKEDPILILDRGKHNAPNQKSVQETHIHTAPDLEWLMHRKIVGDSNDFSSSLREENDEESCA